MHDLCINIHVSSILYKLLCIMQGFFLIICKKSLSNCYSGMRTVIAKTLCSRWFLVNTSQRRSLIISRLAYAVSLYCKVIHDRHQIIFLLDFSFYALFILIHFPVGPLSFCAYKAFAFVHNSIEVCRRAMLFSGLLSYTGSDRNSISLLSVFLVILCYDYRVFFTLSDIQLFLEFDPMESACALFLPKRCAGWILSPL